MLLTYSRSYGIIIKFNLSDKKKRFISDSCVLTTIWMHHMDTNKLQRENAKLELHKNSSCCLEENLEATPRKRAAVLQPASYLTNHSSKMNKMF